MSVQRLVRDAGWYESVAREPHPALREHVYALWGREERARCVVRRLEVPYPAAILSLSFGPRLRVDGVAFSSFVAGLHTKAVLTEHDGAADGVQAALSPFGVRMLLGVPMHELAGRTLALEDVLDDAPRLVERVAAADGWDARLDVVERELAARLAEAAPPPPEVTWAWRRLSATSGSAAVEDLVRELDWSRKRLIRTFRDHVGLPPKTAARVLRFGRAVRLFRDGRAWAELAYDCGYCDQSHFNRDFREFAGLTPTAFARRLAPDDPGVAA